MKKIIFVAIALALGISLLYSKKESSHLEFLSESENASTASKSNLQETRDSSAPQFAKAQEQIPSKEREAALEREFQKTDHAPQIVLDWSADIGQVMLEALKDEREAEKTFSFLKKCAADKQAALPYKAICAHNAKRLAIKFPQQLEREFSELQHGLPEQITSFLAQSGT